MGGGEGGRRGGGGGEGGRRREGGAKEGKGDRRVTAVELGVEEEEGVKRKRERGRGRERERRRGRRMYGRREEETKKVVREDEKERVTRLERW